MPVDHQSNKTKDKDIAHFLKENSSTIKKIAVKEGMVVCHEGQICADLVVLTAGVVRVYKPAEDGRSISLYHISAGESCILTAGCILNQQVFPAIAEAKTDVEGFAIPAKQVKQWMNESEIWRDYIISILSQRFADVIDLANSLAFEELKQRIITWILRNVSGENNEIIITHQEIAEELGTSREVVSRKLKKLENERLITLSRGKLSHVDIEGLKGAAISQGV
ncbi:MAG: Crp/Fnr family transcriptional regulator [Thiotrichaceae bacterium]